MIRGLIKEFYEIAKERFRNNFGIVLHEVDIGYKDISKEFSQAIVFVVENETNGKRCMVLTYVAPKGFIKDLEGITSKVFPHIDSYHKQILHEYAEVFLFHNELLNPPGDKAAHSEDDREDICNHFAKALLKLTGHHS